LFAAWIAAEGQITLRRFVFLTLAISFLYLCHLFAAASLALMIGCFEIARVLQTRGLDFAALARRALYAGALFLPSALVFLLLRPPESRTPGWCSIWPTPCSTGLRA